MEKVRIHAFVSGFVQGVNFRYYTQKKAKELGITGWVRNLKDGRVEVVAEGDKYAIEEFIRFFKTGPPLAKVLSCEVEKEEFKDEFKHFDIIY